jgi:hypothetical protein
MFVNFITGECNYKRRQSVERLKYFTSLPFIMEQLQDTQVKFYSTFTKTLIDGHQALLYERSDVVPPSEIHDHRANQGRAHGRDYCRDEGSSRLIHGGPMAERSAMSLEAIDGPTEKCLPLAKGKAQQHIALIM